MTNFETHRIRQYGERAIWKRSDTDFGISDYIHTLHTHTLAHIQLSYVFYIFFSYTSRVHVEKLFYRKHVGNKFPVDEYCVSRDTFSVAGEFVSGTRIVLFFNYYCDIDSEYLFFFFLFVSPERFLIFRQYARWPARVCVCVRTNERHGTIQYVHDVVRTGIRRYTVFVTRKRRKPSAKRCLSESNIVCTFRTCVRLWLARSHRPLPLTIALRCTLFARRKRTKTGGRGRGKRRAR